MINDEETEDQLFSLVDDPEFLHELKRNAWKEDFEKIGYIYIKIGDEPNDFSSRVYKDKHREFIGFDENYELEVKGLGSNFDWEKEIN